MIVRRLWELAAVIVVLSLFGSTAIQLLRALLPFVLAAAVIGSIITALYVRQRRW